MDFNQYKYRTELHLHTSPASGCSEVSADKAVELYAGLGFDSIVVTNHFFPGMRFIEDKEKCIREYLEDYKQAVEAGKKYGINVILGCEIRFSENVNDYLVFGIDEDFFGWAYDLLNDGLDNFYEKFKSQDTLLLQAHPFRDGMTRMNPKYLDGVETYNMHPHHNSRVALAAKYAKEHDFIVSAGTDFHHLGHEGMVAVLTKEELKTSHDVQKVLRSRDYLFEIGGSIVLPYGM